jgi:ABC-2 type transport system ATP-binding protein
MSENEPIIRIEDFKKSFRRTKAVDGLSLEVPRGQVTAFLGPNGAGKSTTIKSMLNIYRPDGGSIEILGKDSRKLRAKDFRDIGYVSENQELPLWMTVDRFIRYCRPMYPDWDDEFCSRLLKQFDLPLKTKLRALSRGMRMKAALLCSLAYRPKLVVLDEPFSGLDPLVRDEFLTGLLELTGEEGWTVFISSHDIDEVERLCDRIAVIDKGKLKLSEPVDALQQRFRQVEVIVEDDASLPDDLPEAWCQPSATGRMIRFTVSDFDGEEPLREAALRIWPGMQGFDCAALSLREIFVTLAKNYRLERTNGTGRLS